MRILLVSDHYPPFIGGVQRQTRTMAIGLMARGHDVGVVTVWQDSLPAFDDSDGFPVWRVRQLRTLPYLRGRPRRRHQPPGPDPVSAVQLRMLVRRIRPDVVHASGWFAYSAAAAMLGHKAPLVVSAREYGFICANASLLHKGSACSGPAPGKCMSCSSWYWGQPAGTIALAGVWGSNPLLKRRAQALHSVSHYVDEVVAPRVFGAKRQEIIDVVIPSFRTDTVDLPDTDVLAKLPREPFILFVGALRRVKGIETLFAAYERLGEDRPPLVLLGTLEDDTPKEMPRGVLVLGGAEFATVLAAWDRAMFGVMPSLWPEPFGSVVHEAMSRGRAVIGTYPGGHADIIEDGRSGLLVPLGDPDALRTAMGRLIEDTELRARIELEAAVRAQLFTADAVIPQFERLYEQVLQRAPV